MCFKECAGNLSIVTTSYFVNRGDNQAGLFRFVETMDISICARDGSSHRCGDLLKWVDTKFLKLEAGPARLLKPWAWAKSIWKARA